METKNSFAILVPGIFQTSLYNGVEKIFPLPLEDELKYFFRDIINDDLIDDVCDKINDNNLLVGNFTKNDSDFINFLKSKYKRVTIFSYDWRKSLLETKNKLITFINNLYLEKDMDIILFGISAGGIISYMAANDTKENNIMAIKKIITIGTPFKGCLRATNIVLGIDDEIKRNKYLEKIIHSDSFISIYELMSQNLDTFVTKNNKKISNDEIMTLFKNQEFINQNKLKYYLNFVKYIDNIVHNEEIELICFACIDPYKNMCIRIDIKDDEMIPIYSQFAGDGLVLIHESYPHESNNGLFYKINYSQGQHASIVDRSKFLQQLESILALDCTPKNDIILIPIIKKINQNKKIIVFDASYEGKIYEVKKIKGKCFLNIKNVSERIYIKEYKKRSSIEISNKIEFCDIVFQDIIIKYNSESSKIKKISIKFDTRHGNLF